MATGEPREKEYQDASVPRGRVLAVDTR